MFKFNTPQEMRKYLSNVPKIRGTHLQCVNNHYAKFEYKGMKSVYVTDTIKAFWSEKMSKFNITQNEKVCMKCTQNRRCTSSR